jgi:phosphate transport system permease protein
VALTTPSITSDVVARRLQGRSIDHAGLAFRLLLGLAITFTLLILGILLVRVISGSLDVWGERGVSDFIQRPYSSRAEKAGVYQGIVGTVTIGVFVLLLAVPTGLGAAIYLEEYAAKSRFSGFIDTNIRNLAGVPSVVYGILGYTIFVKALKGFTGGASVMAAGITLAILVLPIVIITSAEAIRAVPDSLREAGFGVGATRWEVIRAHVLPYAVPGILTGTILSLARALGEAAPLILIGAQTGFFTGGDPGDLTGSFNAMPNLIARWTALPSRQWDGNVQAAIVVLLVIVLCINAAAILLRNRYEKKR